MNPSVAIALPLVVAAGTFSAAALFRVAVVDEQAAVRRAQMRMDDDVLRSPGPDTLSLAAMEQAPMWADILWLQIVQELGKPAEGARASWDRVQRWSNIAVDLDEKYYTIYYAAAIQLITYANRGLAADDLLMKGRKALPNRWELPFLLGYTAYFLHGDATSAAEWWEEATRLPESPHFMPSLAARARYQAGDELGSIAMLESMLESLEGTHRLDAEIRLKLLKTEPRLRAYDDACKVFQSKQGRLPRDGQELYAAGLVTEEPFDLLGDPITIDNDCRARSKYIIIREDEARQRIGKQGREGKPE
jgi:hypothetical protein